jgi:octopine/nopaline transport system permease protein
MDFSLLVFGDDGWGDEMLRGALMTMAVAVCSYLLGVVIFYTTVIRGIPELLVIYLVFFGGGTLLRTIASGMFGYEGYIDPPLFVTGMVCIGLSAGAYNTEVIRGAVLAVPAGQI